MILSGDLSVCMSIGLVIENGFLALRPPSGGSKPGASMGLRVQGLQVRGLQKRARAKGATSKQLV